MSKILNIFGREILDSRGYPTVEAEVHLDSGIIGISSVPSGASVGKNEAIEIRDKDENRFFGKGVKKAVQCINEKISKILYKKDVFDQENIDFLMIKEDGTENKSNFGANAILAVSLSIARAAALQKKTPLYKYIAEIFGEKKDFFTIPLPMINIINGGKHANNNLDIQEFMIQPVSAKNIKQALQMSSEIFQILKNVLQSKDMSTSVGDEGGYSPNISCTEEALDILSESVKLSNYNLGKDIKFCLDCAASELFDKDKKKYFLKKEKKSFTSEEFAIYLKKIAKTYPISSIEDSASDLDWDGFKKHTLMFGNSIQIVGDDIFTTNKKLLMKGIKKNIANSILIKLNQIGTLTETLETIKLAKKFKYNTIISHRSGETEDSFIADLSVGVNSGQIKSGSMSRSERICKYNRLIRIEEEVSKKAIFWNCNNKV
ncbi:phosphopyruvate hydratase [bacterium endosymbiont of Pedicinus badii]|uniref:phosphopyruvate hydratase n=1 Tax=bacterium endosymbiont of Pedicinus badii TaxID=1719126 RepID=UPI0009BC1066|nr:phosphopyruvate hydratase [bacterium endosymbiont of Pedicinus badii]OQM34243.1 enolase [bacterium endosymbiont of Pedicinus badii]